MDFDRRLTALRDRRLGLSKLQKSMAFDSAAYSLHSQRSLLTERYQRRVAGKAVKYTLGAMEEVNPDYTAISVGEAERISKQLINRLPIGWDVECELQGSVPLNVHIEGVSDVDFLAFRTDYFMFDPHGPRANTYGAPDGPTVHELLSALRTKAHAELKAAYPACDVDGSGSKSLCMTGGSLRRKVDVVPAMWKRTAAFQAYGLKKDKGVVILDSHARAATDNLPFLHIHEVHSKDQRTAGGTKKVVRLLKTVKEDSDDKAGMTLSSYDIAGLAWHMEDAALTVQPWEEISLLAIAQAYLNHWRNNRSTAMALPTPDGTRMIVQDQAKFRGLTLLSLEVDALAEKVALELEPSLGLYPSMRTTDSVSRTLRKSFVPTGV